MGTDIRYLELRKAYSDYIGKNFSMKGSSIFTDIKDVLDKQREYDNQDSLMISSEKIKDGK